MGSCLPLVVALSLALTLFGCRGAPEATGEPPTDQPTAVERTGEGRLTIDERSYRLGAIGAFAEMVGAGVKLLALSSPMHPEEMAALISEARRIASDHDVGAFLETDFLVTDLFPPELTEGKEVLLICRDDTYRAYQELKEQKASLLEAGQYKGQEREEIARRFGEFLSYPVEKIDDLLEVGSGGR